MEICAVARRPRFFHAICQVAKCTDCTFARNGHRRSKPVLDDDHIDILGLEAAKQRAFASYPLR
jgi:hypothetical protein